MTNAATTAEDIASLLGGAVAPVPASHASPEPVASATTPQRPSRPGVTVKGSAGTAHIVEMMVEADLCELFGTRDRTLARGLLSHCLKALSGREAGNGAEGEDERNVMLSLVHDLAPRDAVERMLSVQMAATHVAVIRAAAHLARSQELPQAEAHYTGFNKLTRTFTAQVEALQKHRRGGRQTVVVQHVTVADGGQAIVGHVEAGTRDRGVGG